MAILVVDDERNFTRILEAKLRKSAFEVRVAHDAAGALNALIHQAFDLVVLDLHLPDTDGLSALPLLQQVAPDVAVIVMTAYEEEGLRARVLAAGAVDILYKPFDLNEFVRVLQQRLSEARAQRGRPQHRTVLSLVGAVGREAVLSYNGEADTTVITAEEEDTFAVVAPARAPRNTGADVLVRIPAEDGVYEFHTHVVGAAAPGSVTLAKPHVIHRRQRREHARYRATIPVRITPDSDTRPAGAKGDSSSSVDLPVVAPGAAVVVDAMTVNVSSGGLLVSSGVPLDTGTTVHVKLAHQVRSGLPTDGVGKVVRSERVAGPGGLAYYRVALRFVQPDPDTEGLAQARQTLAAQ